jgi:hypothetical protein
MIHSAKILANQPSDKNNFLVWANSNEKVSFVIFYWRHLKIFKIN